jgi:hypothetical protein
LVVTADKERTRLILLALSGIDEAEVNYSALLG